MAIISADNLPDAKSTLPREEVSLRDFGIEGEVYVRALTSAEEKEAAKYGKDNDVEGNSFIASRAAVDEHGEPVFKMTYLRSAYGRMARHLAQVSLRLSGLRDEDLDGDEPGKD